jgi:hypothetical protein
MLYIFQGARGKKIIENSVEGAVIIWNALVKKSWRPFFLAVPENLGAST